MDERNNLCREIRPIMLNCLNDDANTKAAPYNVHLVCRVVEVKHLAYDQVLVRVSDCTGSGWLYTMDNMHSVGNLELGKYIDVIATVRQLEIKEVPCKYFLDLVNVHYITDFNQLSHHLAQVILAEAKAQQNTAMVID